MLKNVLFMRKKPLVYAEIWAICKRKIDPMGFPNAQEVP